MLGILTKVLSWYRMNLCEITENGLGVGPQDWHSAKSMESLYSNGSTLQLAKVKA